MHTMLLQPAALLPAWRAQHCAACAPIPANHALPAFDLCSIELSMYEYLKRVLR